MSPIYLPYVPLNSFPYLDLEGILKLRFDLTQRMLKSASNAIINSVIIKWRILSQPGRKGSGKNRKKIFCLLGLKITLRTCFESNNFLSNSCPELSNQVLSFSEGQIYYYVATLGRQIQLKLLTSGGQVWT